MIHNSYTNTRDTPSQHFHYPYHIYFTTYFDLYHSPIKYSLFRCKSTHIDIQLFVSYKKAKHTVNIPCVFFSSITSSSYITRPLKQHVASHYKRIQYYSVVTFNQTYKPHVPDAPLYSKLIHVFYIFYFCFKYYRATAETFQY